MAFVTTLTMIAAASAPGDPFVQAVKQMPGLIAHWRMDGDFRDAKGTLNGTANGPARFADGVAGKAAVFRDGSFAMVEQCPELDLDRTSVAFFFRVDELPGESYNPCLVAKRRSSPDTRFSVHFMKDSGALALWNGQGLFSADPPLGRIETGEWHHFAATADDLMTRIYIDGVLCASTGGLPRRDAKNLPFVIAASSPSGDERFTGAIDEVMVFDRALSSEEIAVLVDSAGWKERREHVTEVVRLRIEERQRAVDERRKADAARVAERLEDPALTARSEKRVYEGENLTGISLPVGGIGAGNIQFNGNAEPHIWQIFNNFAAVRVPESYFAIRAQSKSGEPVVRALQTVPVGGFPAMQALRFSGEYPFGWYEFADPALPVGVRLEVFNPLIPLDAQDSAIPCAIVNVTVENTGDEPVEVDVLAAQQNAVGFTDGMEINGRACEGYGGNINRVERLGKALAVHMLANSPEDSPGFGDMALTVLGGTRSASADWPVPDKAYDAFLQSGTIEGPRETGPSVKGDTIAGAVSASLTLKQGKSEAITFVLAWHFPNADHGVINEKWFSTGNMYANWYANALAVAGDVSKRLTYLTEQTRLYHDTMYASNLPRFVLDRVTSQVAVLRSMTCFWAEDGYFGGWEGCNPAAGCCHGNCGHVWHYAQSHARLFPSIARTMREQALSVQEPDGALPFRQPTFMKAVDAQCGEILGVYREHLTSADGQWLRAQWPRVKKAMEYTIATWDADEDGLLSGVQHNTLDINVTGSTSWLGTLYVAALRASDVMASLQNDEAAAQRFRRIAEAGATNQNDTLFNGEYYIQIPDTSPQHDYGNGCCIDQVLGQWWAHQLDLGWIYPMDRVQSSMRALLKYNFHDNYHGIEQVPRKFVHDDDAGLQMLQWPREIDRPQPHTLYADEVWTGTEYSAAAAMIQAGMVKEGLLVVKAAYDRYDGRLRTGLSEGSYNSWGYSGSPFGDEECGKFYARAMSVWSLLLAAQGFIYDGPAGRIGFAPQWRPDDHQSFFTAAEGYGLYTQTRDADTQTCAIEVRKGSVEVSQLVFEIPAGKSPSEITVELVRDGRRKRIPARIEGMPDSERVVIALDEAVRVEQGHALQTVMEF